MIRGVLFKRDYTIRLADHEKTVVVEGPPKTLKDVARVMRWIHNGGHFKKVSIIKVRGLDVNRLRVVFGTKSFDDLFPVQAEYLQSEEHYMVVKSNNKSLPEGRPILFSSPPRDIRLKKI